jgi:kinesin family member C2/C3
MLQIRDLLTETNRGARLEVQNTKVSGANVPDALQIPVTCTQDVLDVMHRGQANRATADTKMNERSSRSHSVLTVIVNGESNVTGAKSHGCLHLIDLAGSERVGRSEASGDRLEEAKHINKSLSSIGDVMSALASRSKHIPFRCEPSAGLQGLGPLAHFQWHRFAQAAAYVRACQRPIANADAHLAASWSDSRVHTGTPS